MYNHPIETKGLRNQTMAIINEDGLPPDCALAWLVLQTVCADMPGAKTDQRLGPLVS